MAWQNVKPHFFSLFCMLIYSQGLFSLEVDVNCLWNQALPLVQNVSVVCHTSAKERANECDLCQLRVITSGHRHQFPSTCASTKETFNFSISKEHIPHIRCKCNGTSCNFKIQEGYPPSPPSRPNCVIEDLEKEDIYCTWIQSNDPMNTNVYTLHWEDYEGNVNMKECDHDSAIINRAEYTKSTQAKVWITASNMLGYAQSEESVFNTAHIKRPDPPSDINHTFMPLEISWIMSCDIVGPLDKTCQMQYRMHSHMLDWIEVDDCQATFQLEDSLPFTEYSFRIRCHCGYEEKVMSNWSSVYSVRTPPAAPVGQLDVWSDCAPNSDKASCNVCWKEMPMSQARGEITNYIVTLKFKNGTEIRQKRDTGNQQRTKQNCTQIEHFLLKPGVVGVFVSASTSMGTSDPTVIPFPLKGQTVPKVNLSVMSVNQALLASWSVQPQFSESVLEYVVQHVPAALLHPCLNWVKVKRNQTSVTLKGDFRIYTAYNVSLFAVFNNHSTLLQSTIAYTLEGVPPEVPELCVMKISHSSVTLNWHAIPDYESNGVILHYLVGVKETGFNMSSNGTTVNLFELQPSQQYQAWVSAVTAAGEGNRSFITFSTSDKYNIYLVPLLIALSFGLLFVVVCVLLQYYCCFEKIPDPINSKSFKHMNLQHVWPLLCSPSEMTLKISELEIVEDLHLNTPNPPSETELENDLKDVEPQVPDGLDGTNEGGWLEESEESNRGSINRDDWKQGYSEMVDTDEEEKGGVSDEEWWDSVPDYERHFMPSTEAV